ncbi:MAG TPA: uL22 family ribosomal protein [Candidatus Dojkabacteria bacterium]|nr:uL22 family ribosomal protein [Candidatus Dojkabacteria bacterium]
MTENVNITSSSIRRGVFSSPQKARLVADLIRDMSYSDAIAQLTVSDKKVSESFIKALKNAYNGLNAKISNPNIERVKLTKVMVGESKKIKGMIARAKGRGDRTVRRFCDIYITLSYKA